MSARGEKVDGVSKTLLKSLRLSVKCQLNVLDLMSLGRLNRSPGDLL